MVIDASQPTALARDENGLAAVEAAAATAFLSAITQNDTGALRFLETLPVQMP